MRLTAGQQKLQGPSVADHESFKDPQSLVSTGLISWPVLEADVNLHFQIHQNGFLFSRHLLSPFLMPADNNIYDFILSNVMRLIFTY